ncbi:MAG: hypothetical protein AAGD11_12680 [Planctomycetota bacterium]
MLRTVLAILAPCIVLSSTRAEPFDRFAEPSDESSRFQSEELISELQCPAGIAFRPTQVARGPFELLLAESGAGRVISVETTSPNATEEVIVGFPVGTFGPQSEYRAGPMTLAFVTSNRLAVGMQAPDRGTAQVATYALLGGGPVLQATQVDDVAEPNGTRVGAADQLGLLITEDVCYFTGVKTGSDGWVLRGDVEANRLSPLRPFVTVNRSNGLAGFVAPAAVPSPRPNYFVAGTTGSVDTQQDSRLVYCLPETGEVVMNLPTGLNDVVALAYGPSGRLYAADFNWSDAGAGGVFRLDDTRIDGRQSCRAVKIATVVRPFGLAFAPDGALYVTSFGDPNGQLNGKLIKITGDL